MQRDLLLLGEHHAGHEGVEVFSFALILSKRKAVTGKSPRAVKASGGTTQSVPAEWKAPVMEV